MSESMTHRDLLLQTIANANPKGFPALIKSNSVLYQWVMQQQHLLSTASFNETIWCLVNQCSPPRCKCGAARNFATYTLGYRAYCNNKCSVRFQEHSARIKQVWSDQNKLDAMVKKRTQTVIDRYGVDNVAKCPQVQEKIKKTNFERYGNEIAICSDQVVDCIKQTNLERYGVEWPFQSLEISKKAQESFRERYPNLPDQMALARAAYVNQHGANPFAVESVKNKIKQTRQEKYGYMHAQQHHLPDHVIEILEDLEKFKTQLAGLTLAEAAIKLGVNPTTVARRAMSYNCRDIFSQATRSKWEYQIQQLLNQLGLVEGVDYVRGDRTILKGKELDFYFPTLKVAIEVGSLFWHSELNAERGSYYHYNKWKTCREQNVDLYQYWDFELSNKWNVIESKIKYMISSTPNIIGARKINTIAPVEIEQERQFLEQYHLQGFSGDRSWALGAWYNEQLVAVMCLAKRSHSIEVVRFATDLAASYPGLFSKMLINSLKQLGIADSQVTSFSDNRHSAGRVYASSGFQLLRESRPSYAYTRNYHALEHKKKFTKQKIAKKFDVETADKTEWLLMQELGYDRIWDAGKLLWSKHVGIK
jgi:hypothetical protein